MPITETSSTAVVNAAATFSLSQFFTVTAATANPAYLVVCALDRNEYTVTSNGDKGSFSANGATLGFSSIGGDGNGSSIVYTWQKTTGQYTNTTYGALSASTYTASDSPNDVTNISLWGSSNASTAQQLANNAYALIQNDASGYLGSVTIATQPGFSGTVPLTATPDGVAAAALSFVGDAWNENGCWVLASTIAAEAGASLPVQSTAIAVPGHSNGEWVVVYNGPVSTTTTWQSLITTGDIIDFVPVGGGGHVTTCVSGTGTTAMLVDNIAWRNGHGGYSNAANDGSAADLLISAPHAASGEFNGVAANSVVIYALDTPVLADHAVTINLAPGKSVGLSTLFTASDPAGHAITQYQAYDTLSGDSITLNGHVTSADSASNAATATSLGALGLLSVAADTGGTDTIDIRAYNGTYWGDWQTETVTLNALPPVLGVHTPNQTWTQGMKVNVVLPVTLFTDPQGQALTYSISAGANSTLPVWLNFNATTRALTGTVPAGMENFAVTVTATDTGGLSNTETFTVNVPAAAPVLTDKTASQSWAEGSTVSLSLPSDSFTDPQGQTLTFKATQSNGGALPSWLHFSASTLSFSGTAPATAQSLQLKITATDTSGLSATETIVAAIVKAGSGVMLAHDWTAGAVLPTTALPPAPVESGGFIGIVPHASDFLVLSHHG